MNNYINLYMHKEKIPLSKLGRFDSVKQADAYAESQQLLDRFHSVSEQIKGLDNSSADLNCDRGKLVVKRTELDLGSGLSPCQVTAQQGPDGRLQRLDVRSDNRRLVAWTEKHWFREDELCISEHVVRPSTGPLAPKNKVSQGIYQDSQVQFASSDWIY